MPLLIDDMTEPDRPVTRRELREELDALLTTLEVRFAGKDDLKAFATKDDLKAFATKDDLQAGLKGLRDELRSHFDAVAESFREQFGMLYDGVKSDTKGLDHRVKAIETGHGDRLLGLETRVTALELGHPPTKGANR